MNLSFPAQVAKRDKDAAEADAAVGFGEILRMLAPGGVGGPVDGAVRAPLRIALAVMLIQQSRAASRGRDNTRKLSTHHRFSGINAVIFFSGSILGSAGMANRDLGGCIIMAIQVGMTALSCVLMDRAGRRTLLLTSLAGMALAAGAMALFFAAHLPPLVALAALVLYIAAFAVGLGPIPWLLMAEILPARARREDLRHEEPRDGPEADGEGRDVEDEGRERDERRQVRREKEGHGARGQRHARERRQQQRPPARAVHEHARQRRHAHLDGHDDAAAEVAVRHARGPQDGPGEEDDRVDAAEPMMC